MSENGISLFRVSPDDGDQGRDVPLPVSPSPVDGQDPTGIHPDEIDKNERNEKDKMDGRPLTPGKDKDKERGKMDNEEENNKNLPKENLNGSDLLIRNSFQ